MVVGKTDYNYIRFFNLFIRRNLININKITAPKIDRILSRFTPFNINPKRQAAAGGCSVLVNPMIIIRNPIEITEDNLK